MSLELLSGWDFFATIDGVPGQEEPDLRSGSRWDAYRSL